MSTFKITDGNHLYWSGKRNGYWVYYQLTGGKTGGSTYAAGTSPVFTIPAGASVILKAKNITYKSANANNTLSFGLMKDDDTVAKSITIKPSPAQDTAYDPFADVTSTTTTFAEETPIKSFRTGRSTGTYNTTFAVYFDIEMYVNGIRWI